jgi:polyvinyl alcohol dehydrogenase (cytochrome)
VVALDAATGRIIWKSYVITEPLKPVGKNKAGVTTYGPAGGAVWSSPAIDVKRKLVYVGAGNGYIPADTNGTDAVIAMDMKTGAIRWTRQFTHYDPYVVGCEFGGGHDNCPTPLGPDADVSGGVIIRTLSNGHDILLAGTKGGEYAALDPDNKGAFVWRIRVGAGSALGGVHWGAAADADKAYVAVSDVAVRGEAAHPSLQALDLATGKVVWDTATPKVACAWGPQPCGRGQSQAVSAMEGAIFSGALDGRLRAYAAGDGKIIWDFDTGLAPYNGGSLDAGGPTIAEGMVFVHSGYPGLGGFGRQQNVLLAFSVDGK